MARGERASVAKLSAAASAIAGMWAELVSGFFWRNELVAEHFASASGLSRSALDSAAPDQRAARMRSLA